MHRKDRRRQRAAKKKGPISVPSRAEIERAIEGVPGELPWAELAPALRPVFLRRRPLPPGSERPPTFHVGPGLKVALGVDIGPAFIYVGDSLLESWEVTGADAFARAMENLRASAADERWFEVEYAPVADIPIWWYQSREGLASGLLLLEQELAKRCGDEPRLLAAPMRNLLLSAPFDADREVIGWLRDELSFEDPNGLDLPLFALVDGRLSVDRRQPEIALVH